MSQVENNSETPRKNLVLPQGMRKNVLQSLSGKFNTDELSFRTIFVKNLKDEEGNVVVDLIQPRYIHIYGDSSADVREAARYVKELLGDAFETEESTGDELSKSEENSDSAALLTHYRSRCIEAKSLINPLLNVTKEERISQLLKSTMGVHIMEQNVRGMKSFTAISTFIPRTADLIHNSGLLHYSSPLEAMEKLLKNETTPYNKIIDLNFDTVVVKFNDFEGEIEPPLSADEFVDFFRKKVITQGIQV